MERRSPIIDKLKKYRLNREMLKESGHLKRRGSEGNNGSVETGEGSVSKVTLRPG